MLKSLTTRCAFPDACCSCTARSVGDILKSLRRMKIKDSRRSSADAGQPQKYITHERTLRCNGEGTGARPAASRVAARAGCAGRLGASGAEPPLSCRRLVAGQVGAQTAIQLAGFQQLAVASLRGDRAAVEHEDSIGVANRGQAVG